MVKALGDKLGVEVDELSGACGFDVDGQTVVLLDAGDLLLMHADVGESSPEGLELLYRNILEANFLYHGTGGSTLSLNPGNGHVVLQKYNWMERLDADSLVEALGKFADTAIAWKKIINEYRPDPSEKSDVSEQSEFMTV